MWPLKKDLVYRRDLITDPDLNQRIEAFKARKDFLIKCLGLLAGLALIAFFQVIVILYIPDMKDTVKKTEFFLGFTLTYLGIFLSIFGLEKITDLKGYGQGLLVVVAENVVLATSSITSIFTWYEILIFKIVALVIYFAFGCLAFFLPTDLTKYYKVMTSAIVATMIFGTSTTITDLISKDSLQNLIGSSTAGVPMIIYLLAQFQAIFGGRTRQVASKDWFHAGVVLFAVLMGFLDIILKIYIYIKSQTMPK